MKNIAKKSHTPVLLQEVISCLEIKPGGMYIDATFGAGGYSSAILRSEKCLVRGIDRDKSVEKYAKEHKQEFGDRFSLIYGDFANLKNLADQNKISEANGIVFDIGVSSMQIDEANRGFSFMHDGPLDMRMDQTQELTAEDIVNEYQEEELADIFFHYGGERKSRRIAKQIINSRNLKRISSTAELSLIIKEAAGKYHDSIHPATRSFQALRIEVNNELDQLKQGIEAAANLLKKDGVLAVVTFHSAEDFIVKQYFRHLCGKAIKKNKYSKSDDNNATDSNSFNFTYVNKKVITSTREETLSNPRARSAKLRAIRRLYESI